MSERKRIRKQRQLPFFRRRSAVAHVPVHGVRNPRRLHAYLMRPARMQANLRQRQFVFKHFIIKLRILRPVLRGSADIHHVVHGVFSQIIRQRAPLAFHFAHKHRQIFLFEIAFLQALGKPRRRLRSFRVHHYAARGSVQTVHKSEIHVAALFIRLFNVLFDFIEQIIVLALVRAATQHLRLQRHDDMIVLV